MAANPFKAGDTVVYEPSDVGRGKVLMTDFERLEAGRSYKVVRIERDDYLVLEGFESSPGGGLFWTEFARPS